MFFLSCDYDNLVRNYFDFNRAVVLETDFIFLRTNELYTNDIEVSVSWSYCQLLFYILLLTSKILKIFRYHFVYLLLLTITTELKNILIINNKNKIILIINIKIYFQ